MKIREVRERTVGLGAAIRNAYIDFSKMTVSVVAVESDVVRDGRPVTGYGFASAGRYAQGELTRERVVPRILAADPAELLAPETGIIDPERVNAVMRSGEKPGGHGDRAVAISAVDVAVWDLAAKLADVPLAKLFADRYGDGTVAERVWVYAAGGYYDEAGPEGLARELAGYKALGADNLKMKIGLDLALDRERVAAASEVAGAPGRLAVDASGSLDLPTALAYAEMLEPFDLLWYEDAGDPLDFEIQAALGEAYAGPLATGENLFARQEVTNLLRYGRMRPDRDLLLVDPALCYGPTEYVRIVADAAAHGFGPERFLPHGGHQLCLAIAAGLHLGGTELYPGVFKPIGGFADGLDVVDGHVSVPEAPGLGTEEKTDLWRVLADV